MAVFQDCYLKIVQYFKIAPLTDGGVWVGVFQFLCKFGWELPSYHSPSSHLTQLVKTIHIWHLNIQQRTWVSVTWKWIRNISVILASCAKVFLASLPYMILMSFAFSLLHVETIGERTQVWRFGEQRYLCPLNKRLKFLATLLEGLDYDCRDCPWLLECFRVSGHAGLFQRTTYLFKHKKSLKVARFASFFFPLWQQRNGSTLIKTV